MKRLIFAIALLSTAAQAQPNGHHGSHDASPYAGQQSRDIKSLSPEDIAELKRGGGWGLAKPAELNGFPGPRHLLDLKNEIPLTAEQVTNIEAIFQAMKKNAIAEGERLIARERALEEGFRKRALTDASLKARLAETEQSRAALRHIHLSAHLAATALLSDAQIARYAVLRGYATDAHGRH